MDLSGLELELGATPGRAFRLRDAIAALNTNTSPDSDYTYVLIDCPPSLNLLDRERDGGRRDAILVPLQCEFFALEGLSPVAADGGAGALDTQPEPVDPRHRADHVRLAQQSVEPGRRRRARQFMGAKVYDTMIPRNVPHLRGAVATASRCWSTTSNASAAQAYLKLATEVIQRERELRAH